MKLNVNKKGRSLITTSIIVILSALIIFFGYQLINYYLDLKRNDDISKEISEIVQEAEETPEPTEEKAEPEPEITEKNILPEILALRKEYNEDVVAYVRIPGTNIDYAVVQSEDNEYYLNRDIYRNANSAGTIYMDYENDPENLGYNTILYGHNMRNGSMFHNLRHYMQKDYFEAHPVIEFKTVYEDVKWQVFAFLHTDTSFYYIQTIFQNDDEFYKLASEIKARSRYDTGVEITPQDKILLLSTCASEGGNNRYVLAAKLITEEAPHLPVPQGEPRE